MKDDEFERTMDAWAEYEEKNAPVMRPTPEMYEMVRARQKRSGAFLGSHRLIRLAAVAASIALLAVIYQMVFGPSDMRRGWETGIVGVREGLGPGKVVAARGSALSPKIGEKKGPKKGPVFFTHLTFQFQKQGSNRAESIHLLAPQREIVTLTSADNYRLSLQSGQDIHLYVFQRTSSEMIARIFPNELYSALQNPLQRGQLYNLPSDSTWLHLDDAKGQERLYILAFGEPAPDLEDSYNAYASVDEIGRQELLPELVEQLTVTVKERHELGAGLVYSFENF